MSSYQHGAGRLLLARQHGKERVWRALCYDFNIQLHYNVKPLNVSYSLVIL